MKRSDIVIAAIWIVVLALALFQGFEARHAAFVPPRPLAFFMLPFFMIVSFGVTFLFRRRLIDVAPVRWLVDRKMGNGAYDRFVERLRLISLLMVVGLVQGITGLLATYATTQNPGAYF